MFNIFKKKETKGDKQPVRLNKLSQNEHIYVCPNCGKKVTKNQQKCERCNQKMDWRYVYE